MYLLQLELAIAKLMSFRLLLMLLMPCMSGMTNSSFINNCNKIAGVVNENSWEQLAGLEEKKLALERYRWYSNVSCSEWRRTQFKMGWQTSKNLPNTHPPRTVKLSGHY
ncbi:unnamed protein product [Macrosiphum euphorbiae]|uniref:Secreted protein n=1 Tax=Macrosiphum euphorbiae TaxID=13131 RepID=A0AAV0WBQ2_9HEMI|nr:unnamed protein product [Macrosiphum euphorbiae]